MIRSDGQLVEVGAALERRGADPTKPWGDSTPPTNGQTGLMVAGLPMNDDAALSITTVGTCISLLTDGVATMNINALKKTKDRSKKIIDPPPTLIDNPWPEGTRQDFFTQVMVSLLLRGNFYGLIVDRDSGGYATTVMPLHPDRMTPRRNPNTGRREYRVDSRLVDTANVLHIPSGMLVPGSFVGLNPVEYQRRSWGLAQAVETYGSSVFANSATPGGVITVEGDLNDDETLALAMQWKGAHQGVMNAGMPAVLTGGATWQQVSMTPDDAQFLATRQFEQQQIISWFRIPPHKVGVQDRSPGPTITEELEMQYVTDGLLPWAVRIEAYLSRLLRPSQVAKFDFSSRLRGNTLARYQAYQISANSGLETIDEIRAKEDEEPLPNGLGEVIARPMNMSYFDSVTGNIIPGVDPATAPANPGGLGDGGGDPNNSPAVTKPDQ